MAKKKTAKEVYIAAVKKLKTESSTPAKPIKPIKPKAPRSPKTTAPKAPKASAPKAPKATAPKAPKQPVNYSRDLTLKAARANRLINAARKRLKEDIAKGTYDRRTKRAVDFAKKEIESIYGKGAEGFKLKGMTDHQIQQIESAIDRVLAAKALTKKGLQEVKQKQLEGFYGKPYKEITKEEREIFDYLLESGTLEKVKEIDYRYEALAPAIMDADGMPKEEIQKSIYNWVNNVGKVREQAQQTGRVIFKTFDPETGEIKESPREVASLYDYVSQRYAFFTEYNKSRE